MKGTEKQIKYAMDILDKVKAEAEKEAAQFEKAIAKSAAEGKEAKHCTRLKESAERIIDAINQIKNSDIKAGAVINRLFSLYDMRKWLSVYDGDATKLIESMANDPFIR